MFAGLDVVVQDALTSSERVWHRVGDTTNVHEINK